MMATSPSSRAVFAAADVWTSRSEEPADSRRFPTSEIRGSRSDRWRSPKTEIPLLVSTSAYGRSETETIAYEDARYTLREVAAARSVSRYAQHNDLGVFADLP
jgi:hypothetical protein